MLDMEQVWDNALRAWARYTETGEQMWWERATGLFDTYWGMIK